MKLPFPLISGNGTATAAALIAVLAGLALMAAMSAQQRQPAALRRPD